MMKTLVIDRKTWFRGRGHVNSSLLRGEAMCCLGFAAIQLCEAKPIDISGVASPQSTEGAVLGRFRKLGLVDLSGLPRNTKECFDLMTLNDDPSILDNERESLLTERFRSIGIQAQFIN